MVEEGRVLDISTLPTFAFGHRSPMWWGTMGLMLIEGTVFALTIMSYFYLRSHAATWPMSTFPPDLIWGNINTAVMLASAIPNHFAKQAAERLDLQKVRLWLVVCLVFSFVFLGVRALEFTTLNTRWDSNAYGSVVWMLMGLHTTHLITDAYDSAVLTTLTFTGPMEGKRYVDVSENAAYWYFVVLSWLPIYAVVYFGARY
ncbi:cytochrome C oxidase subunit III [Massilia sp. WF1]|nr:cytochrome C oxidase subunit III [Massilia sp. WG5]KLU36779.1 cytochrome C oxidase subunit III [Massilia sp. WF1]